MMRDFIHKLRNRSINIPNDRHAKTDFNGMKNRCLVYDITM